MRLSKSVSLLALTLATMPLAACGSSSSGGTTLTYWANSMTATPTQMQKVLQPVLAEFTKETGIKVNLQIQDWNTVYPKIVAGAAAGTLPDVFDTGATWTTALQSAGAFTPYNASMLKAIGGSTKFTSASLATGQLTSGQQVVAPLYSQSYALYYNPKLFAKAGITQAPTTWAEFVVDAKRLTSNGDWGMAWAGVGLNNVHQAFIQGRQDGAELFSSSGKPTFDTPQERRAIGRILDLRTVDKVIDPAMAEKSSTDSLTEFAQGHTGMFFGQGSAAGILLSLGFKDFAVAPLPVDTPTPAGGAAIETMSAGSDIAVSSGAKNRSAALELVNFLTNRESQITLNKAFGTIPVRQDLQNSKTFAPYVRVFAESLDQHSEPMPQVAGEGAMETAFVTMMAQLWQQAAKGQVSDAQIGAALRAAQGQMPPS